MTKFVGVAILVLGMALSISAMGLDLSLNEIDNEEEEDRQADSERTILILNGASSGSFLGINLTQLLPLLALAAAALLPFLCLCALGLLLLLHKSNEPQGYGSQHDTGYASSYSQYQRALSHVMDWEKLSIIDWVSVGEETFRKYDPTDMDCHKRLICEVHQNVKEFGEFAYRFVQVFGYLKYTELFNLPAILQDVVDEFIDAADSGRSLKRDCGDTYPNCEFSVAKLYKRFSLNDL